MIYPLRSFFLALPLEAEAKRKFQDVQNSLLPFEDFLRFQKPETPHLTLMFWREVGALEYQGIVRQVEKIAAATEPFTLRVTEAGTFGSRGQDRVLFLNVAFSDALARVKKLCPWTDGKPFHPHITLARIAHPQRFRVHKKKIIKLLEHEPFLMPVNSARLYATVDSQSQTPLQDFVFTH